MCSLHGEEAASVAGLSVNGPFIGGAERGLAFYAPRYGNALSGTKMSPRIKGAEASVTLRNLDYGERSTNPV